MSTLSDETTGARKTTDERKELLARHVSMQITQGWRVESQSDFQSVLIRGRKVNHVLHLIVTLVTIGVWGVIWIALVALGGEERQMVQVDEWGNASVVRLGR